MTNPAPIATTGEIAALLGAELVGPPGLAVVGVESLDNAGPGCLSFIRSSKYASRWASSLASAALVSRGIEVPGHDAKARALIVVDDADRAMFELLRLAEARLAPPPPPPGVHPTAIVSEGAVVPASASVGPFAVIGNNASIGEGAIVGAHTIIADRVRVGDGTRLHPRVTLLPGTTVGRGCLLFPGVVVGADGFGFIPGPEGPVKLPHLAGVRIGDLVEIGANTTIDRGKFSDTVIGDATKIDNQVQLGHGCRVGRGVLICGCCAIGGSVTIGDGAVLGGHLSVRDNITIGAGAQIGGGSAVDRGVPEGETWWGWPAREVGLSTRAMMGAYKHKETRELIRDLSKRVRELEGRAP